VKIQALGIEGCFVIQHDVFPDERGLFREWFKLSELEEKGLFFKVAQANLSISKQGVIRGMHYSLAEKGQSKLITCINGQVLDVLVDIRIGSPTFMMQEKVTLSSAESTCILIETGVAHGFLAQNENSTVAYLLSGEYEKEHEKTISPFDDKLQIEWGHSKRGNFVLSERDQSAPTFELAEKNQTLPRFKET